MSDQERWKTWPVMSAADYGKQYGEGATGDVSGADRVIVTRDLDTEEVKAVIAADGIKTYEFVLSTARPDRDKDIVVTDGLDTTEFEANPIGFWNHCASLPICVWPTIVKEPKRLLGACRFYEPSEDDDSHFAKAALGYRRFLDWRLSIRKGKDRGGAVSIGFKSMRRPTPISEEGASPWMLGMKFEHTLLLEVSHTMLPANGEALARAIADGVDMAQLADLSFVSLSGGSDSLLIPRATAEMIVKAVAPASGLKLFDLRGAALEAALCRQAIPFDAAHPGEVARAESIGEKWEPASVEKSTDAATLLPMAAVIIDGATADTAAYRLIHHRASDGAVVYRGLVAACAELAHLELPAADRSVCETHLGRHFSGFERKAPWESDRAAWDRCSKIAVSTPEHSSVAFAAAGFDEVAEVTKSAPFGVVSQPQPVDPAVPPAADLAKEAATPDALSPNHLEATAEKSAADPPPREWTSEELAAASKQIADALAPVRRSLIEREMISRIGTAAILPPATVTQGGQNA